MHQLMKKIRSALYGGLALALLISMYSVSEAQIPGPPLANPGSPAPGVQGPRYSGAPQVLVPLGSQVRFQMSSRKDIEKIYNPKQSSLQITVRPETKDATTVYLTGVTPDVVRVEFVDVDGVKELYDFVVQLDVEFLKLQLRRAVQTANLQVVPTGANTVLITGTVSQPQDVELITRVATSVGNIQVINGVRVGGVQQVQLDVVVAQVSRREFRRMAFDFLVNSQNFFFGNTTGGAAITPALIGTGGALSVASNGLSGAPGTPNGANTNLVFGVLHSGWGILGFLQALRDEGLVKTLAEPRLVTLSGRPASFLAGGEQPIPVPAGLGQVGIQFTEFGTRLNFLPIVLGNGKIHLEVEPEVSNLDPAIGTTIQGTVVPGRNTSRVNTTVQLEPGQTFVIGGLIQHEVRALDRKTPILGDIPFLGTMFSSKGFDEQELELVVLVTPHLVDAMDCHQTPKTLPGQETRSPDDFELFLECILEAPRGPRKVWNGYEYVPAYKNGPSAGQFPCGGVGGYCSPGTGMLGVPAQVGTGTPTCGPAGCGSGVVPGPRVLPTELGQGQPTFINQTPVPQPPSGALPVATPPAPGAPLGVEGQPRFSPPPALPPGIE